MSQPCIDLDTPLVILRRKRSASRIGIYGCSTGKARKGKTAYSVPDIHGYWQDCPRGEKNVAILFM